MQTSVAWINQRTNLDRNLFNQQVKYEQELADLNKRWEVLQDYFEDGELDKEGFWELNKPLQQKVSFAEEQIRDIKNSRKSLKAL